MKDISKLIDEDNQPDRDDLIMLALAELLIWVKDKSEPT
jgi:hypothetical protein